MPSIRSFTSTYKASRSLLLGHGRQVASSQGQTFRQKVGIVIISSDDLRNEEGIDAEGLVAALPLERAMSAALSTTFDNEEGGSGEKMILVTLGFNLCQQSASSLADLVVHHHGWKDFHAIHVLESEGLSSAINRAMVMVVDASIVAVFTPSFRGLLPLPSPMHHDKNNNATTTTSSSTSTPQPRGDIFMSYEQTGRSPLLLTSSSSSSVRHADREENGCWHGMPVPLLVFDDDTYRDLGPFDEVIYFVQPHTSWYTVAYMAKFLSFLNL